MGTSRHRETPKMQTINLLSYNTPCRHACKCLVLYLLMKCTKAVKQELPGLMLFQLHIVGALSLCDAKIWIFVIFSSTSAVGGICKLRVVDLGNPNISSWLLQTPAGQQQWQPGCDSSWAWQSRIWHSLDRSWHHQIFRLACILIWLPRHSTYLRSNRAATEIIV